MGESGAQANFSNGSDSKFIKQSGVLVYLATLQSLQASWVSKPWSACVMGVQTRSLLTEPYSTSRLRSRHRQQRVGTVFQDAASSPVADAVAPGAPDVFKGDIGFRTSPPAKSESPSSGTLQLVPKFVVALQGHGARLPKWAGYDPKPDWTLADLKGELESLSAGLCDASLPRDTSPPNNSTAVSWQSLRVVADFGREQRGFVMRWSDSDSEDSDEGEVKRRRSSVCSLRSSSDTSAADEEEASPVLSNHLLPRTEPVGAALFELERERLLRVQEETRHRQQLLQIALVEESQRSQEAYLSIAREEQRKCEITRLKDENRQRSIAEARDIHLSALQRDHEQRAQVEESKIRKEAAAEAAHRREIAEKEEKERQIAAKAEAEARKKKDEALIQAEREKAAAESERKKQAEAVAAAAAAETLKKLEPKQKQVSSQSKGQIQPRVSERASKLEYERKSLLQSFDEDSRPLVANPALKKDLKSLERSITKILQQISATQEQVRNKTSELGQLLGAPSAPKSFLMVTLGNKLLSQCEGQVQRLPSFAFPLAQVVVNVAAHIPSVMDAVVAKLNEACIYTVPKYFVFSKNQFSSDAEYYKALGYRVEDSQLETTDSYVARMISYITFYAAITQTQVAHGDNPHGLQHAWSWCASLLNKLPANRLTASALEAFLKIAGYRLHQQYPKPFMKLMETIVYQYIVSLKKQNDTDANAVVTRLETYLHMQQFTKEPEGRRLPLTDISSTMRA